jgi:hypothetical protein
MQEYMEWVNSLTTFDRIAIGVLLSLAGTLLVIKNVFLLDQIKKRR